MGITKCGIRLDSGDLTYLSRKARKMLDEAGLDRVPDRRLQRPGRVHHPGPAAAGGQHRHASAWASGSSPPAASRCSAASTSWPPWRMTKGQHHPQDQDQRERRQDHQPPLQEGLPPLRPGHRQGRWPTISAVLRREESTTPMPLELFDPDATWKRKTIRQLYGPAPAGARLPERQAGLPGARSWMTSGPTACSRWIRSGMRSSALRIRTQYYVDLSQRLWDIKNELLQRNAGC